MTEATFRAVDPVTGAEVGPEFVECGPVEVDRAAELARGAFGAYRRTSPEDRAVFL